MQLIAKNMPLTEMALWNDSPGNVSLYTFVPSEGKVNHSIIANLQIIRDEDLYQ